MNTIFNLAIACSAGFALGTVFFGGLWLTIRKIVSTKLPMLLFFGSFMVRATITLVGFYFIAGTDWQNLVACLLGFAIARYIVNYLTKPKLAKLSDTHEVKP